MKQLALGALAVILLMPLGPAVAQDGAAIYQQNCAACHDRRVTINRQGRSVDQLAASVIAGMPGKKRPRAGTRLSDAEIRAAVGHLVSK
jgi:mono/diheme cytochrome c family protein